MDQAFPLRFYMLQPIKNWTVGRPGNKAMCDMHQSYYYSHSVPSTLDCGYCLAGNTKVIMLECANTGGEGNFRLMAVGGSDKPQELQVNEISH